MNFLQTRFSFPAFVLVSLIGILSATITKADTTLTIQPKNCNAIGIYRSLSYTFYADYYYSLIKPLNNGELTTGALGFDIMIGGPSSLQASLSFVAPESLWNDNRTRAIPITFPASGPGTSVDNQRVPFNINTTTSCLLYNRRNTFSLGCMFTIPFTPTQPDTFQTSIKCIISYVNAHDTSVSIVDSARCYFNIIMFDNRLNKVLHNGAVSISSNNNTYAVFFDTSTMITRIASAQDTAIVSSALGIDITGEQLRTFSNKLVLPTHLENQRGNLIGISFPTSGPGSLARLEWKSFSNPHQLNYFNLGSFGGAIFRLGYIITIPPNSPAGIYTASVLVYNEYTLLDYPEPPTLPPVTLTLSVAIDTTFLDVQLPPPLHHPFRLHQNYPNPFNPGTDISFTILSFTPVDLSIYNLLGHKMETIFSGMLTTGVYTKHWDASSYPSGIYFYRLKAGNAIETRKLLLMK